MSTAAESIIRQDIGEVWNSSGSLDIIDEIVAEDFVFYDPMGFAEIRGPDEYRKFAERFRAAFANMGTEIEEIIAKDDRVAARVTMRATHEGEFIGIEPTNREVELKGIVIEHIEDGKIKDKYINDDRLTFFAQLGAVEPPDELITSH
ncbi:ester cyclase [Haladaptatus litoreus]|nr:ester cyclase [Haladaptatus litoreus]